jgi:hypothetical protein
MVIIIASWQIVSVTGFERLVRCDEGGHLIGPVVLWNITVLMP